MCLLHHYNIVFALFSRCPVYEISVSRVLFTKGPKEEHDKKYKFWAKKSLKHGQSLLENIELLKKN
jgi:hypothetical protein